VNPSGDLALFAEKGSEVPDDRIELDVLDRQGVLVGDVELAATCGLADVDPVGGLVTVSWEREHFGSIGLEALFTGRQTLTGTLTPNPYRTMSPSFVMFGVLLERQVGPVTVFLNGENLTDRRLTRFQPLVLPAQAPDGRWTTDAWGPLDGRVISLGVRWRFGELSRGRSTEDRDDYEPSDLERPILDDSGKP